jgi:hypothetical protein
MKNYSSKKQKMKHERSEGKAERKMEYGSSKGKKADYSSSRKSCK